MRHPYTVVKAIAWFAIFSVLMLALSGLFGCVTNKNFNKYVNRAVANLDSPRITIIAETCGRLFPIVESSDKQVVYLPGETKLVPGATKYIAVDCDSAVKATLDEASASKQKGKAIVYVPVMTYMRVDTDQITNTIIKKSTADLVAAQGRANGLQKDKDDLQAKLAAKTAEANEWRVANHKHLWWALWTWIVIVVLLIVRICWKWIMSKIP